MDKDRWPARQLGRPDRQLEEPWPHRRTGAGGRSLRASANGKARSSMPPIRSGSSELNAADFGDLLLETLRLFLEHPDVLADYHRRFRYILVDEYQDTNVGSVPCGCACWRRARPTSAASATTISRSTAGAAPTWTTSCASSRIFPARRLSASNATIARPATSSVPPPAHHPANKGRPRQDPFHRRRSRLKADRIGRVGRRGGGARDHARHRGDCEGRGTASTISPFWCALRSRCARSKTAS